MNLQISVAKSVCLGLIAVLISCNSPVKYYSVSDFGNVPKIDAHFHYLTTDTQYMQFASSLNVKILNPNWDGEYSIDEQLKISVAVKSFFPHSFAFFGTFAVDSFGKPGFASATIERIKYCLESGASGIKIWKNIGMV